MPWSRWDDRIDDDPDLDIVGLAGLGLFTSMVSWSSRHGKDGFVPEGRVYKLAGADAERLVKLLMSPAKPWVTRVEGGYMIRNFLKYNPSAAMVAQRQEEAKERMRLARSGGVRANVQANTQENEAANQTGTSAERSDEHASERTCEVLTVVPRASRIPYPNSRNSRNSEFGEIGEPDAWEDFLSMYPARAGDRKVAPGKKKFIALLRSGVSLEKLLQGVKRYRAFCDAVLYTRTERVQQITTWLNGSAWEEPFEIPEDAPCRRAERETADKEAQQAERDRISKLAGAEADAWRRDLTAAVEQKRQKGKDSVVNTAAN